MTAELPIEPALPFDPVLPVNYLSTLLVGALLSSLLTEVPRTELLVRVNRAGASLRESLIAWIPGLSARGIWTRGAVAILLVLVMRLVVTTLLRTVFPG